MGSAIPAIRLGAAWLLTCFVAPYAWGRSFVGWQMTGRPETRFASILVAVLVACMALTWHVAADPAMRRRYRSIIVAVALTWVVVNVVIFFPRVWPVVPRPVFIAAYLPGSLIVPWLGWMCFDFWSWRTRLAACGVLVACLAAFNATFCAEGLTGDSKVLFRWRFASSQRNLAATAVDMTNAANTVEGTAAEGPLELDPARDFPQFLGPNRTGVLPHVRIDRDWAQHPPRELWRHSVGLGWSSFAVVGDYAFTQEQRGDRECLVCYRLTTGDEVWINSDAVNFTSSLGGPGPRATPTFDGGQIFAVGATGVLKCVEAQNGKTNWLVNILDDNQASNNSHGVCASPLVLGERVLVCPTGSGGPSLAAYDRHSGQRLWRGGIHGASYSSPLVSEFDGTEQILLFNAAGVTAHDPTSGAEFWHFDWANSAYTNVSQPIVYAGGLDRVFVSTGYDKGCALIRVDHSADGSWSAHEVWSNNRLKTKFCSAVMHGEHVFGLDDGILACLDLAQGTRTWKAGRYGHGQILCAGDLLIVQAEDGDVILVELDSQKLRELGRVKALTGKTWNNAALAGPYLLVRNDHEAACYQLAMVPQ